MSESDAGGPAFAGGAPAVGQKKPHREHALTRTEAALIAAVLVVACGHAAPVTRVSVINGTSSSLRRATCSLDGATHEVGDLAPGERATLWLRAPARDAGLALAFACGDAARQVELDAYVPRRGSSGHTVRVTTCTTAAIATDHWLPSPLVPPLR